MKTDYSKQGLSQIVEESDREEVDHPRRQLAKLSNQEFLSHYVELNPSYSFEQHQHLLQAPLHPLYRKFIHDYERDSQNARQELRQSIVNIERAQKAVLSKDELKSLAAKKMEESNQKQVLSTSRKEKQDLYYQVLKTSRRFNSEKLDKSGSNYHSIEHVQPVTKVSMEEPPLKDISTEQTIEDQFLRLRKAGEERDYIKKQWYSWGEKAPREDKRGLIECWIKSQTFMKELLDGLLQRLAEEVGSAEIFRQLRVENVSVLSKRGKVRKQRTLESTGVVCAPSVEQRRMIIRFGQWFNKLLLDERQLEYLQIQHLQG